MKLSTKLFLVCLFCVLIAAAASADEKRVAIIVVYDDIDDAASIQNWVDEIASLNYNAVAVHSRYRGDATYFPNKYDSTYPNNEPRSSSAGGVDVLEEFVTRGHAAGLDVYAYVNCYLVTDGQNSDWRSNHILNTHPDWVTYYYNYGAPVVQTTSHCGEGKWIDPAIPAARAYVANICGDIMMNYDCDGIILDRIRYPQASWRRTSRDFGYHPDAIQSFHAQYGGSGVPYPYDSNWIRFRQEQINASVQEIYNVIKSIDSNHELLAYPVGRYNDAVNYSYQKWPDWMNGGYIDGCFPQIYSSDDNLFRSRCQENRNAYSGSRLLGIATMAYTSGIDVDGQIEIARDEGFEAISPYRHGVMENLGYFDDVLRAFGPLIVDNAEAGFSASGSWWTSSYTPGYYGTNYHCRLTDTVSDSAAWSVTLPVSGTYEVFAQWSAGGNRASSAPYIIYHNGGSTVVYANQRQNGGQFNSLGTYQFNQGDAVRVRLSCWTGSGTVVIADAISLELQ